MSKYDDLKKILKDNDILIGDTLEYIHPTFGESDTDQSSIDTPSDSESSIDTPSGSKSSIDTLSVSDIDTLSVSDDESGIYDGDK